MVIIGKKRKKPSEDENECTKYKKKSDDLTDSIFKPDDFFGSGSEYFKTRNNHIYFYDEVSKKSMLALIDEVLKLASSLKSIIDDTDIEKPIIYLHINSDGGCVYSGLSAMDTLMNLGVKLITIAEGNMCSAATFLYLAGKERWIRKHTYVLIHQIRTFTGWTTHTELIDEVETTKKLQTMLVDLYKTHTNLPDKKLNKLMKREIQMDAKQCIKYKISTKII